MASPRGKGFAHGVRLATLALWVGAWSMLVADTCPPAGISYLYDENGRLAAVIDSTQSGNNVAVYTYDGAGNLTSIARQAFSTVSIVSFVPSCGSGGTILTVYGTGFDNTASNDVVKFANGVTATATAATTTQLTVPVPSTAGSGQIQVQVSGGTWVSSSRSFTVGCGAPTITSFTPTIGTPGTPVTINGTNFDSTQLNDRIEFNGQLANTDAAATTFLYTSVPAGATSGRISVATAYGTATRGDPVGDFFVPPLKEDGTRYAVSDVDFTGRVTLKTVDTPITLAGRVNTTTHIGLIVFDGAEHHRLSIEGSIGNPGPYFFLYVYRPDGNTFTTGASNGIGQLFLDATDATRLPYTGTYMLSLLPVYGSTGELSLTAYDVPEDPTRDVGTPTPGGVSTSFAITTPGENATVAFSGTMGQTIHFSGSFTPNPNRAAGWYATIRKPDGYDLVSGQGVGSFSMDTPQLPQSGTYTVFLDPAGTNTGTLSVTLSTI